MQISSPLACLRRPLALFAFVVALLSIAQRSDAQTAGAADIAPANLPGKTITLNALSAPAPFAGTGIFSITFTGTTYTIPIAQGNPTFYSGAYTAVTQSGTTLIRLAGYLVGGSPVQLVLVPSAASLIPGAFEMFADGVSTAKTGSFTISGGTTGGGGTGNPAITSQTQVAATVGQPFSYQITTSPAATSYTNTGGNAPVAINPSSGLVTGTFTSAGTFNFSFTALNASGASAVTSVTVNVTAGSTGGGTGGGATSTYTGTYTGNILQRISGVTAILGGASYSTVISATGGVVTTLTNAGSSTTLTGTIASNGSIFYTGGTGLQIYKITAASVLVTSTRPVFGSAFFVASTSSTGATSEYSLQSSATFVAGTTGGGDNPVTTVATAPTNLVGYRNKVGGVYQFTVTGSARGAVWGTDVYTDDSSVAAAAVHAGVLADGATGTVTVTILPGQSSYPASTRNGVSAASWGAWSGSYSFAGAGAISTVPVATARPAAAPGFVAGTTALAAGGRLVCPVAVTGGGTYSYRWYLNGNVIAGATANPYIVESLTAANAGTYSADVTNALGTTRLNAGTVTVGSAGSPVLALQPIAKTIVPGATFTLATSATGTGLTYQWLRNGSALAGETGAILLRNNANAADAGNYSVRVSNSSGTVTSNAATVAVSAAASRPANISVRTNVATGTLVTPAFVLKGSGTKRILIRAAGPALAAFGLPGTMENPKLTVFRGSTELTSNDDWSPANIGQAFTATGAFAFPNGSKDAALVVDLPASPTGEGYSVQVTNASGTGGLVLVEVYDADILRGTSTSLIVNVSVRGQTAPGADVLTLGLVIGGQGPRTLLVRGIGPKLASFGVTGTVPDPRLQIVDSQGRVILANDDWASADFVTELALASTYVGAFALDAGSKDAATLSLVEPGAFTIQVSGTAANPSGEALVEVYDVP